MQNGLNWGGGGGGGGGWGGWVGIGDSVFSFFFLETICFQNLFYLFFIFDDLL